MLTHEFPPFHGGVGSYASELAQGAAEIGHDIEVCAPDFHTPDVEAMDAERPYAVRRFPGALYSTRGFPRLLHVTRRALRNRSFDVVHAIDWPCATALKVLGAHKSRHVVCTVFGSEILSLPTARHMRLLGMRHPFSGARQLFAISDYTAGLLVGTWPELRSHPIRITPLGVSAWWTERPQEEERTAMRARAGLSSGDFAVATVARVVERKGQREVVRALGSLPADVRRRVVYIVAGPEPDGEYVVAIDRGSKAANVRVVRLGPIPRNEIRALLSLTGVFVMPGVPVKGFVEGFGLAYLEAGAQGVPSIATKHGGAAEAVHDGVTGLVVPVGDPDALSAALSRLIHESSERERLSRGALQHARAWPWSRVAKATYGAADS